MLKKWQNIVNEAKKFSLLCFSVSCALSIIFLLVYSSVLFYDDSDVEIINMENVVLELNSRSPMTIDIIEGNEKIGGVWCLGLEDNICSFANIFGFFQIEKIALIKIEKFYYILKYKMKNSNYIFYNQKTDFILQNYKSIILGPAILGLKFGIFFGLTFLVFFFISKKQE